MKRRSRHEESQSGWISTTARKWGRCEDCDIRGALASDGHVMTHPILGFRLSVGCETCGGSGLVRVDAKLDRYSTGKT